MTDIQKQKLEEQQSNRSKWESRLGQLALLLQVGRHPEP